MTTTLQSECDCYHTQCKCWDKVKDKDMFTTTTNNGKSCLGCYQKCCFVFHIWWLLYLFVCWMFISSWLAAIQIFLKMPLFDVTRRPDAISRMDIVIDKDATKQTLWVNSVGRPFLWQDVLMRRLVLMMGFCLLLGPPGFNCWFSSALVFQWCCSTPQGSPGVGRNTFLSSPHLCFIIVFICDLFVSRDDPLMS